MYLIRLETYKIYILSEYIIIILNYIIVYEFFLSFKFLEDV